MAGLTDMRNDEIRRRRLLASVRSRIRPADTARVYGRRMGLSTKHAAMSWVGRGNRERAWRETCPKDSAYVSDFKRNMGKNQSVPERIRTSDVLIRLP